MSAAAKHEDRRTYLGSHAFSAITGNNPWQGPMDLYAYMQGLTEGPRDNEAMAWGLRMQDVILDHHGEKHGAVIRSREVFRRHADFPFIGGTADGIHDDGRGVDAKNIRFLGNEWGAEGTDQVPPYILCQCHHFNMLFGSDVWYVAALVSGQSYREYEIPRDREMDEIILTTLREFWEKHVDVQDPPSIDGSDGAGMYLKTILQKGDDLRVASTEECQLLDALRDAESKHAELGQQIKHIENQLKLSIGDDAGLIYAGGKVTWKQAKGRQTIDTKRLRKEYAEIAKKLTVQGAPARVFRKNWKKEGE